MKDLNKIIEKQEQMIEILASGFGVDYDYPDYPYELEREIEALKKSLQSQQPEEPQIFPIGSQFYSEVRELTDEEWMALPKEEVIRLYKNCYNILIGFIHNPELKPDINTPFFGNSGVKVPEVEQPSAEEILKGLPYQMDDNNEKWYDYDMVRKALIEFTAQSKQVVMPDIEQIRQAFADYRKAEGCSCCRDIDAHKEAEKRLALLLKPKPYDDASGYDWFQYCTEH